MPKTRIIKKSELDKFYTKPEIASLCIDKMLSCFEEDNISYNKYIEPSAGDCSFFELIPSDMRLGYDLSPTEKAVSLGVNTGNWFDVKLNYEPPVCIVGNPPFGSRNHLSKAFIKHAISFDCVKSICFILPSVFDKRTIQQIFPAEWKLLLTEDLPKDSFLLEGKDYHVPCVFQIWTRENVNLDLRKVPVNLCNPYFKFCRKEEADLFFFGASPSKIILPQEVKPNNRGYYISCQEKEVFRDVMQSIDWKNLGKSSVNGGVSWLTKEEVVEYYLCYLNQEEIQDEK